MRILRTKTEELKIRRRVQTSMMERKNMSQSRKMTRKTQRKMRLKRTKIRNRMLTLLPTQHAETENHNLYNEL
jgi:hypothetical protein